MCSPCLGAEREIGQVLDMLTAHPARILGIQGYGVAVGSRADLEGLARGSVRQDQWARAYSRRKHERARDD